MTKKVKNLDKPNSHSGERFYAWHEAKSKKAFNC